MKKILILFSLILSFLSSNSQTIIELNFNKNNDYNPFSFVRSKDSIYVEFNFKEDMGARYNFNYIIKKNIPDNEYKIIINGFLKENFILKNTKLIGNRKVYYETGEIYSSESFEEGVKSGDYKVFYKNGKMKEYANYINGNPYIITELTENGQVSGRRYFLPENPNDAVRYEIYDSEGKIARIQNSNWQNSFLYSSEAFKNGELNYKSKLEYSQGTFTLEFKENVLKKAKFEGKGKLINIMTTANSGGRCATLPKIKTQKK